MTIASGTLSDGSFACVYVRRYHLALRTGKLKRYKCVQCIVPMRDRPLCMDDTVKALTIKFPYEIAVKIAVRNFTGTELIGYCLPKKLIFESCLLHKTLYNKSLHAVLHRRISNKFVYKMPDMILPRYNLSWPDCKTIVATSKTWGPSIISDCRCARKCY